MFAYGFSILSPCQNYQDSLECDLMYSRNDLENYLSEIDVWKIALKRGVHVYPDGFYRLNGIFGHSVTFGKIKVDLKKLQEILDENGSIKEPWLTRLAYFMKNQRSQTDSYNGWGNQVLVIIGIMKILTEDAKLSEKSV